jgi:hypothetical protein
MTNGQLKPLIQIDDVVREMTEEEYAQYIALMASLPPIAINTELPEG